MFNQSEELWVGLENHVLQWADAADLRVSVFTAPVLGADDPPYRGIRIPLRFWKVAAWIDDAGELAAAGFILDQSELIDTTEGVVAVAPLGGFRTFQVPIADIGELAGIDFGPLVAADVLGHRLRGDGGAPHGAGMPSGARRLGDGVRAGAARLLPRETAEEVTERAALAEVVRRVERIAAAAGSRRAIASASSRAPRSIALAERGDAVGRAAPVARGGEDAGGDRLACR